MSEAQRVADEELVDYEEEGEAEAEAEAAAPAAAAPRSRKRRALTVPTITVAEPEVQALEEAGRSVRMLLVPSVGGVGCYPGVSEVDGPHHQRSRQALTLALTGDCSAQQPVVCWRPRLDAARPAFRCLSYTTTPEAAAASLSGNQWLARTTVTTTVHLANGDSYEEDISGIYGYESAFLSFPGVTASDFIDPMGEGAIALNGEVRGVDPSWLACSGGMMLLGWSAASALQSLLPDNLCASDEDDNETTGWEISLSSAEAMTETIVARGAGGRRALCS